MWPTLLPCVVRHTCEPRNRSGKENKHSCSARDRDAATRRFSSFAACLSTVGRNGVVDKDRKRILLVAAHNAFRESLASRLSQEEDLEVAWQAGSVADTRDI